MWQLPFEFFFQPYSGRFDNFVLNFKFIFLCDTGLNVYIKNEFLCCKNINLSLNFEEY